MPDEKCPHCGTTRVANAAYCDMCGNPLANEPVPVAQGPILEWVPIAGLSALASGGSNDMKMIECPSCGRTNVADSSFCDRCGIGLPASASGT